VKEYLKTFIVLFFLISLLIFSGQDKEECTTAIISGAAADDGRPMLWKNRDTDFLSNKVIYVREKPYSYLALINAEDISGRWVYAGMNSQGFGIMNSVAYNLPKDRDEMEDLEGIIMADALRKCQTISDFEKYIKQNLGPSLGSWANYGVIDKKGNAAIFEVSNSGYKIYRTSNSPKKYLINSNFARSGKKDIGAGYLRFERASYLFKQANKISHDFILQKIARDFGNPLLDYPTIEQLKKISKNDPVWILTRDTIVRHYTSAAVVIKGKRPDIDDSIATMWVILGEPLTSIALPLWVEAEGTPLAFYRGQTVPLYQESSRIQKVIRPSQKPDKKYYLKATELVNKEGTGYLKTILNAEKYIFKETSNFLKNHHSKQEYRKFQNKMAEKALKVLKEIK